MTKFGEWQSSSDPHEVKFQSWNDALTGDYVMERLARTAEGSPDESHAAAGAAFPLYRAAQELPQHVFQPGGQLSPFRRIRGQGYVFKGSHRANRQERLQPPAIAGSAYMSATRDLRYAEQFARQNERPWIYVMDPQPGGPDDNALIGKTLSGSPDTPSDDAAHGSGSDSYRPISTLDRESGPHISSPVEQRAISERGSSEVGHPGVDLHAQEILILGSVQQHTIRGALPVIAGKVDYAGLVKNPFYRELI